MRQTAEVICDSIVNLERFTTIRYEIWRPLHSELLTYRDGVARNASSSRAIPFSVNLKKVSDSPFVPNYFGAEHKGMMPSEYLTGTDYMDAEEAWKMGATVACAAAKALHDRGVSKSICNRMLEPYNTINVLMTGNTAFWTWMFKQRCSKESGGQGDAEPNLSELCDRMKYLYDASEPVERDVHMPYFTYDLRGMALSQQMIICAARCARLSYCPHGDPKMDTDADLALAKRLLESTHLSPFEHFIFCPDLDGLVAEELGGNSNNARGNALSLSCYTLREIIETVKKA